MLQMSKYIIALLLLNTSFLVAQKKDVVTKKLNLQVEKRKVHNTNVMFEKM